ncbi:12561_t:CDS:2, partial [Dentiscutata heterogama]
TDLCIKKSNNNLKFKEEEFKQFKRKIKRLYTIDNHPNIIKFYGVSIGNIETNTTRTVNPEFEHIPNEEFFKELEIWTQITSFDYSEFKDNNEFEKLKRE